MGNLSFEGKEEDRGSRMAGYPFRPARSSRGMLNRRSRLDFGRAIGGCRFREDLRLYQPGAGAARGRILVSMGQRQVALRAHLDQARGGSLELVCLVAFVGNIKR